MQTFWFYSNDTQAWQSMCCFPFLLAFDTLSYMVHKKISTLWNCAVLIHMVTTRNLVEHFRLLHLTLKEPRKNVSEKIVC